MMRGGSTRSDGMSRIRRKSMPVRGKKGEKLDN